MLDGKQLRKIFHEANDRYWNGLLPDYSIRAVGPQSQNRVIGATTIEIGGC